jgi:hypothetical protein
MAKKPVPPINGDHAARVKDDEIDFIANPLSCELNIPYILKPINNLNEMMSPIIAQLAVFIEEEKNENNVGRKHYKLG